MNDEKQLRDQRSDVRQHVPANRISWTKENASQTYTGWVSDVATASVAFVTPTRDLPVPGEPIELTFDAGSQSPTHRLVRVARTAPHDRFFSVVACQSEPAESGGQATA